MKLVLDPEWKVCYFTITEAEQKLMARAYRVPETHEIQAEAAKMLSHAYKPAEWRALRESPEVKALEEKAYGLVQKAWDVGANHWEDASRWNGSTLLGFRCEVVND